jgi:hypothetical protein
MTIRKVAALAVCVLLYALPSLAQKDWVLKKQKDGITIYVKEVPGSALRAFKAETELPGSLAACLAVLRDIDGFTTLFPLCKESRKVMQNDTSQIHYLIMEAPWPVSDRDGVFKFRYRFDKAAQRLTVSADIVPGHVPTVNDMVRLLKGKGEWSFTAKGKDRTHLSYTFHGEPGGSIPGWLADQTAVDTPFGVLSSFRNLVVKPQYQGKSFKLME